MKNRALLYIPLVLLFVLSAVVYYQHARPIVVSLVRLVDQKNSVRFPFGISNGKIVEVLPEAASAGMQKGDALVGIAGRILPPDAHLPEELDKFKIGDTIVYTVERSDESGAVIRRDIPVEAVQLSMTLSQTAGDFAITFLFMLCLPAISYLLGFYVAFLRPGDRNAWLLLFLLIGIGSIAVEGGPEGTLIRTFQEIAMNFLGIWMLLFGIYFPERLDFDRKVPWAKWILIAPLLLFAVLNLGEQIGRLFSIEALWRPIDELTKPYDSFLTILSMVAFGGFFAAMATKSGTTENPDSRRRLRILYAGTTIAMLPALTIIIYRIASGKQGGFQQLVPEWYAILALLAILLFPLTMAYVIVVQRAMDVSVVIRQGLQYALARNGVLAIQIVLSFFVILIALSFVSDSTTNRPRKMIFIGVGIALVFLFRMLAGKIRIWMDKKFFREAYNAEQILSDLSDDVRTMVETKPPARDRRRARSANRSTCRRSHCWSANGANFVPAYALGFDTPPVVSLSDDSSSMRKLKSNRHIVLYDDMTEVTSMPVVTLNEREQLTELNTQMLLPDRGKERALGHHQPQPKTVRGTLYGERYPAVEVCRDTDGICAREFPAYGRGRQRSGPKGTPEHGARYRPRGPGAAVPSGAAAGRGARLLRCVPPGTRCRR